jgi:hypothetical protein
MTVIAKSTETRGDRKEDSNPAGTILSYFISTDVASVVGGPVIALLTNPRANSLLTLARRCYTNGPCAFTSSYRGANPMEMNWMTIVAIVVILFAVGFLVMRRRKP